MKNLILILAITLSLSACKKEKMQNCMVGEWKNGSITLTVSDDYFKFATDAPISYSVKGSNTVKFSNGRINKVICNVNTLELVFISQSGPSPAIAYEGTYVKK